MTLKLLTEMC